jgi:hypothetical protein
MLITQVGCGSQFCKGINNMPNIKEIRDGGENPNTPTIKEMRDSQRKGSEGQGTSQYTYAERMAIRNQGTGLGEGKDEQFPKAGEGNASLPWE